ncbi:MAG TPA: aminotransferase class V-fold PLP-dependent enzyme [Vicinamibacterales bacterium]
MSGLSRRDFARYLSLSGGAALLPPALLTRADWSHVTAAPLPQTPAQPDERFWTDVRSRFLVPREVAFLNAANLCPASLAAVEALEKNVRAYERSPSPDARSGLMKGREEARRLLAGALRVTPEEIVLTRNTTESNNLVSSGLDLGAGDEVIVWADNHPSNLNAWRVKAQRFGFTVVTVPTPDGHPGPDGYVEIFTKAFTPRTKLVAITHVSSNSGDLLPAAEICAAARARGILSLVDGAQAFGVLDLDLGAMKPDFYTGSMHKWPCGPKEKGLLYANAAVHDRLHLSIVGLYGGQVGLSRTFEANGQRDDASIAAVVESLQLQGSIGRSVIERRARQLAQALKDGLRAMPGVRLWTDPDPARSAAIVIVQPGSAEPRRVGAALTAAGVVCTVRGGRQNPGLRFAPHFYNTMEDIDRTLAAVRQHL